MSVTYIYPPTSVSVSFPAGASTEAKQDVQITAAALTNTKLDSEAVLIGSVIETAPTTDTASSGLNGRLQRITQRLTSLIALFPVSIGQTSSAGSFSVALSTEQESLLNDIEVDVNGVWAGVGNASTDVAAVSDVGVFSIISMIKRSLERWTLLLASIPASLGQKAKAASFAVTLASDQEALPLSANAATEAKQDTLIAKDFATSAKQDTLIAKDFATQATLAALLVELALKADLSETQPVSIATAIPSTINAGTITSAQIAVGTGAVRATVAGTAPNAARKKLMIKPSKNNTGAIYLGGSTATTANSMEIIGPDRLEFEFDASDFYLVSDTAAQVVEIIEVV